MSPATHHLSPLACALACLLLASGCATYQFGSRSMYRSDIRTIHVPMFGSDSLRPDLGERLTEAVVKRIEQQTPYKVVATPLADSTLSGRIVLDEKLVVGKNEFDEPRTLEMMLALEVEWVDRFGRPLFHRVPVIQLPPAGLSGTQSSVLIPEAGQSVATSQQEAIDRLAREIVDQMQLAW